MKVPRHNFAAQYASSIVAVTDEIRDCLLNGQYLLSRQVEEFERSFASYIGAKACVGVNSGTDALSLALRALGISHLENEVITQANTFNATVAAIHNAGATPVLVDAEEDTFLIDQSQVDNAITSRTKALLPVHLYGKPTPMTRLQSIARSKSLIIVEDASHAHGASLRGKRVGTSGHAACFSFNPSKNLGGAGDGGAVVTNIESVAEHIRSLRAFGLEGPDNHVRIGVNSKLDTIQAIVLSSKLPYLDQWNVDRARIANSYRERLADLPISFQRSDPDEIHANHLFQIKTTERDRLLSHLRSSSVDAVVRYPTPIHLQPAFAEFGWRKGQFPVAERLANELLCLPLRPDISLTEIDYVTDVVRSFFVK